ncbi:hypothetical protein P154DRAFT_517239 [Amniculicola lignicola CBS 123094]|uniref:Protein kinase domain-containing protein n=1 Tax=Amniculicola lignicola CBS 123094 TaxID=1392246 RepID=A0A6A5X3U0_9PLEO|nr:hypothetical protein P154DRAFT_517239 [Amniculicola lignicola CBS 123094]
MGTHGNGARMDIKRRLESWMKSTEKENKLALRGSFIPEQELKGIMTLENIMNMLPGDVNLEKYNDRAFNRLAKTIKDTASKVYAVLILIDQSDRICDLMDQKPPIDDNYLFQSSNGTVRFCSSLENLRKTPILREFAEEFYKMQWALPQSLTAHGLPEFGKDFIFPFASPRKFLGGGSYGEVCEVTIPAEYLEMLQPGDSTVIAYKRVRRVGGGNRKWNTAKREALVLQARRDDNITPLLASFVAGYENATGPRTIDECLYLISPRAYMDMKAWLTEKPDYISRYFADENRFQRHICEDAMLGLISGLTHIHRELDGKVGYHGDIKPGNLLLFVGQGQPWTWRICDFGAANLKSADDTKTIDMITTPEWAPSELTSDKNKMRGETHGRPHDIFSMGCVFLCLGTILKRKWGHDGLPEFDNQRKSGRGEDEDIRAFSVCMDVVQGWIKNLQDEFHDPHQEIFELIKEMLLQRKKRVHAWEVEVDLFAYMDNNRNPGHVHERLIKAIKKFRGFSSRSENDPLTRAIDKGRSKEFLAIVRKAQQLERSPVSSTASDLTPPSIQTGLSMFPDSPDDQSLYDRETLFSQIEEKLNKNKRDVVALYGISGAGKTSVAIEFAMQLKSKANIKHALIVGAKSPADVQNSYSVIAAKIRESSGSRLSSKIEDVNDVKAWLENKENGSWVMVVDGLGADHPAKSIRHLLPTPKHNSDKMLITTGDKAQVHSFLSSSWAASICVEVQPPSAEDSLRIFSEYIGQPISQPTNGGQETEQQAADRLQTTKLLETLWLPNLIKRAAKYMNEHYITVRQMNGPLAENGSSDLFGDYLESVLKPLIKGPLSLSEILFGDECIEDHREVYLLFNMAFFGEGGVENALLERDYESDDERSRLFTLRKRLVDCVLIKPGHNSLGKEVWVINGNIQMALLRWIDKFGGKDALLRRYDRALSMVYRHYVFETKTREGRDLIASKGPHAIKLSLMSHFEAFVKFVHSMGESPPKLKIELNDTTVLLIMYFSHVLLDQDNHKTAMGVVEYAMNHYGKEEGKDIEQVQNRLRIRFRLRQHLVKIYMSYPEDEADLWTKAERVIESSKDEAGQITELEWGPTRKKRTVSQWELLLDQVRVEWKSNRCKDAREMLEDIIADNGGRLVEHSTRMNLPTQQHIARWVELREGEALGEFHRRLARLRKFFIEIELEDGMLRLAEGSEFAVAQNAREANQAWRDARKALSRAEKAAHQWFGQNEELISKIQVSKAVADTKIGDSIQGAIDVLNKRWRMLETKYGSCKRTWDMERKLNAALLKGHRAQAELGVKRLKELLLLYRNRFGERAMPTLECEKQLQVGLESLTEPSKPWSAVLLFAILSVVGFGFYLGIS